MCATRDIGELSVRAAEQFLFISGVVVLCVGLYVMLCLTERAVHNMFGAGKNKTQWPMLSSEIEETFELKTVWMGLSMQSVYLDDHDTCHVINYVKIVLLINILGWNLVMQGNLIL